MNSCAICGKIIIGSGLCNACWKEWTCTGTFPSPQWLREIIKMHRSFEEHKLAAYEIQIPLTFQRKIE